MGHFSPAERAFIVAGLVLLAAGCDVTDISAQAPGYTANSPGLLDNVAPRSITVQPFTMNRGVGVLPGRIGERTTIGNVSMGYVTLTPAPEIQVTNAIRAELAAAGHSVAGGSSRVSGTVEKFALSTPATALYWDVTIDAAIQVNINGTRRDYAETCVRRTGIWPSDDLIAGVANECIRKIMSKFRNDKSVANAL